MYLCNTWHLLTRLGEALNAGGRSKKYWGQANARPTS